MPVFEVKTSHCSYPNVIQRGVSGRIRDYLPQRHGKLFVLTTNDVWQLHGSAISNHFQPGEFEVLRFEGGESNKRLANLERLAEQMSERGADRTSIVIGFGGGIVTDMGGFLAAIFMRGIPVLQIPTTLLAQVDAATGGKTGVNLRSGKNLIGSFHQPLAVLIDPELLSTLPEREYRAGLFEVLKCGIIRDPEVFRQFAQRRSEILAMDRGLVDSLVAAAVRVKVDVVSADEKEGDLRRILNFGHTIGHAIEAETEYTRLLHGEAIAWGMIAATELSFLAGLLSKEDCAQIEQTVRSYGPLPSVSDLKADHLIARLAKDKKTLGGKIHFVLATGIGTVEIVSEVNPSQVEQAIVNTLQ
ncbi:MAG: 3-dehydroquinate synthase [Bryobacteraceae bacterium]